MPRPSDLEMEYTQLSLEQQIEAVRTKLSSWERDHFDQSLNIEADRVVGIEEESDAESRTSRLQQSAERISFYRIRLGELEAELAAQKSAAQE